MNLKCDNCGSTNIKDNTDTREESVRKIYCRNCGNSGKVERQEGGKLLNF